MSELDHKAECWRIDAFELWTLESPLDSKEIKPVNSKGNQLWIFIGKTDAEAEISNTLATWYEELLPLMLAKRAEGEGDGRGCNGWMASLTPWTWVGANSGRQWRTGKPGVLQSVGSQRVGCDCMTKQQYVYTDFVQSLCYLWAIGSIVRVTISISIYKYVHNVYTQCPAHSHHINICWINILQYKETTLVKRR